MSKNMKVVLAAPNATDEMRRIATRVIDGKLIKVVDPGGRTQEAIAIYRRMLGIKATVHEFEVVETDDPPYVPEALPVSELSKIQKRESDSFMEQFAGTIAEGVARGLASLGVPQAMTEPKPTPASSGPVDPPKSSVSGAPNPTQSVGKPATSPTGKKSDKPS